MDKEEQAGCEIFTTLGIEEVWQQSLVKDAAKQNGKWIEHLALQVWLHACSRAHTATAGISDATIKLSGVAYKVLLARARCPVLRCMVLRLAAGC